MEKCSPTVNSISSSSESISLYGVSGLVALSFNLYEPGGRYPVPVVIFLIKSSSSFHSSNSFFGSNISATIKYNSKFIWNHRNNKSYYGASLKALEKLGKQKKYILVGVDKNGVNAFFVRNDLAKDINLKSKKTEEIFLDNKREIRNKEQYINESKKLLNQKLIKI